MWNYKQGVEAQDFFFMVWVQGADARLWIKDVHMLFQKINKNLKLYAFHTFVIQAIPTEPALEHASIRSLEIHSMQIHQLLTLLIRG